MERWWEQDIRPPEWWPHAPIELAHAAARIAQASDELRWDHDTPPINEAIDRRIWALWRRAYWSKYPAEGLIPAPLTLAELDAELRALGTAIGHLQAQADEMTLGRLGACMKRLDEARELWAQWDRLNGGSGLAGPNPPKPERSAAVKG